MTLARGEVYRRLIEALPADGRPVNQWTRDEVRKVRNALKPVFKGTWFRREANQQLTDRLKQLEAGK